MSSDNGNNVASQSHSPLLQRQRLSPLNGNSSSGCSNNSTTVTRGIINRKDLNREKSYNNQEQRKNSQQRQHVHLNDNNGTSTKNFQTQERGQCSNPSNCSKYPPFFTPSSSINSPGTGHSQQQPFEATLVSAQEELDCFLDLYEERHGLEPLDMNQVQGLSPTSLRLSRLITSGTSQEDGGAAAAASYQKTAQISQNDSRKTPIKSSFSSLDLSCLPVATLSQDDIQDTSLSNNKDLKFQCKKQQPLSPIREDKREDDQRNVTKIPHENISLVVVVDNAEVKNGKSASAAAAVKKTSTPKRAGFAAVPLPPQQPQRIDNSKNAIVIGEKDKLIDCKENCTAVASAAPELSTPKCLVKLPIERRIPSEAVSLSGPTSTVAAAAKSHNLIAVSPSLSLVQKSKIPVPLPKTKINTAANAKRNECRSSTCTVDKISTNNNNNNHTNPPPSSSQLPPPLKKQLIVPHRVSPVSRKETLGTKPNPKSCTPCRNNKTSNNLRKATTPERKIGQGDEVLECLNLIDGLSRQTTWVMNKVLELPVTEEDAMKRIKRLKQSPEIGDFFGVPYIKKEALTHMLFTNNGHFSK